MFLIIYLALRYVNENAGHPFCSSATFHFPIFRSSNLSIDSKKSIIPSRIGRAPRLDRVILLKSHEFDVIDRDLLAFP